MLLPCPWPLQCWRLVLRMPGCQHPFPRGSYRGGCGFSNALVSNQGFTSIFLGEADGSDELCQWSLRMWSAVR